MKIGESKRALMVVVVALIAWGAACSSTSSGDGEAAGAGAGSGAGGSGGEAPGCGACDGCCNGATCVPLTDESVGVCGKGGAACSDCGAGFACAVGTCVVDTSICSPASCPGGCCSQNHCVLPESQDWSACGPKGGGACGQCGMGAQCTNGACDEAHWSPNAHLKLLLHEVSVSGNACSDGIGAIDPKVQITLHGKSTTTGFCTDSYDCDYQGAEFECPPPGCTPADFTDGTASYAVLDDDTSFDDSCTTGTLRLAAPLARHAGIYDLAPPNSFLNKFQFELVAY